MKIIEAVTRWCPFAHGIIIKPARDEETQATTVEIGINAAAGSFNRYVTGSNMTVEPPIGCNCLGPRCAAWRWNESWAALPGEKWPKEDGKFVEPTGYCGLAGPEKAAP